MRRRIGDFAMGDCSLGEFVCDGWVVEIVKRATVTGQIFRGRSKRD
jgi:hypothetical protein